MDPLLSGTFSDASPGEVPGHKLFCCVMPPSGLQSSRIHLHARNGLQRLLGSLEENKTKTKVKEGDMEFLKDFFETTKFQNLMRLHQKMLSSEIRDNTEQDLSRLARDVTDELDIKSTAPQVKELCNIFCKPHVQAFLKVHDSVIKEEFFAKLPDIPYEVDEDEESVKIVRLVKDAAGPLGATIKLNERTGKMHIARILHGGAAERSGLIHVGDEVHEVNGVATKGKHPNEVVNILTECVGSLVLKLVPIEDSEWDNTEISECKMRVRAQFTYNPKDDRSSICQEAGLSFNKGDILHIVSQEDNQWWQARREGDASRRVGLIPSRQQIQSSMLSFKNKPQECSRKIKGPKSPMKFSPKLNKKAKRVKKTVLHQQYLCEDLEKSDDGEMSAYQEVEKYFPKIGKHRPIVLIGPPGVGRKELKRRLIRSNPNHFKAALPYTSQPLKDEAPVKLAADRHLSICEMEQRILHREFVEFWEEGGHYYGSHMQDVCDVLQAGHVCVICPHAQALRQLCTPDIQPYVIFVRPPSLQKYKETRTPGIDHQGNKTYNDEEFHDFLLRVEALEKLFGMYFDQSLINSELDASAQELLHIAQRIDNEPSWVPVNWNEPPTKS